MSVSGRERGIALSLRVAATGGGGICATLCSVVSIFPIGVSGTSTRLSNRFAVSQTSQKRRPASGGKHALCRPAANRSGTQHSGLKAHHVIARPEGPGGSPQRITEPCKGDQPCQSPEQSRQRLESGLSRRSFSEGASPAKTDAWYFSGAWMFGPWDFNLLWWLRNRRAGFSIRGFLIARSLVPDFLSQLHLSHGVTFSNTTHETQGVDYLTTQRVVTAPSDNGRARRLLFAPSAVAHGDVHLPATCEKAASSIPRPMDVAGKAATIPFEAGHLGPTASGPNCQRHCGIRSGACACGF